MALDPVCYGRFPGAGSGALAKLIAAVPAADLAEMHEPPDFVGYNIYNGWKMGRGADGNPAYVHRGSGYPRTALKWPITPEVMNWGVRFLYERYPLPTTISENGLSCNDKVYLDGAVHGRCQRAKNYKRRIWPRKRRPAAEKSGRDLTERLP